MIVRVRLFATLRRHHPHLEIGEAMDVDLPDGATMTQLITTLSLPPDQVKVIFVNNIVRDRQHALYDGDEIGIFPAVGGG